MMPMMPEQQVAADMRAAARTATRVAVSLSVTNIAGVLLAVLLGWLVVPAAQAPTTGDAVLINAIVIAIYTATAAGLGTWFAQRRIAAGFRKLTRASMPRARREQLRLLRTPLATTRLVAAQWLVALAVIPALNVLFSVRFAFAAAVTIIFTGVAMSGLAYLITEYFMRPLAQRVLAIAPIGPPTLFGVLPRQVLGWVAGTASAVAGLLVIAIGQLAGPRSSGGELALAATVFAALALGAGLFTELLTARAIADPVHRLRVGLATVEQGDLTRYLQVDDATDIGLVQDGFNRMVDGLRERERTRAVLTHHVGADVAEHALTQQGAGLGGDIRDVCVVYIDIIGSTDLAANNDPRDVVAILNRFLDVVVRETERHGGSVNKFQGDAALIVFGAPGDLEDAPDRALALARTLPYTLATQAPEVQFGVGASGGKAVAGNIGTANRHEYTVIGDPVNEAARLSDAAKQMHAHVAAAKRLTDRAREAEKMRWQEDRVKTLRGRRDPTRIMRPSIPERGDTNSP
jgi:adenylate cyclase